MIWGYPYFRRPPYVSIIFKRGALSMEWPQQTSMEYSMALSCGSGFKHIWISVSELLMAISFGICLNITHQPWNDRLLSGKYPNYMWLRNNAKLATHTQVEMDQRVDHHHHVQLWCLRKLSFNHDWIRKINQLLHWNMMYSSTTMVHQHHTQNKTMHLAANSCYVFFLEEMTQSRLVASQTG